MKINKNLIKTGCLLLAVQLSVSCTGIPDTTSRDILTDDVVWGRACLDFATEGVYLRLACFPPSRPGHSSILDGSRLVVGCGSGRGILSRGEGDVAVPTVSETGEKKHRLGNAKTESGEFKTSS